MKTITDLEKKATHLTEYLKRNKFFSNLKNDTLRLFPAAKRGNKIYAWVMQRRIDSVVKQLLAMGQTYFVTLTHAYDKSHPEASWKYYQREMPKFVRRLKPGAYKYVYEAHLDGGCHAHLIVAMSHLDVQTIKDLWDGHVKVTKVSSVEVGQYLTKELGKQGHVETALKHVAAGTQTDADIKKINRFYYLTKLKMRGWGCSRNLKLEEPEESETDDLIKSKTNSTEENESITLEVPDWIKKKAEFRPWTGTVPPDDPLYPLLRALFETFRASNHPPDGQGFGVP